MQTAYYLTLTTHITSCKSILDDMMSIRTLPRKVGHDLDLKNSVYVVCHTVKCMLS